MNELATLGPEASKVAILVVRLPVSMLAIRRGWPTIRTLANTEPAR